MNPITALRAAKPVDAAPRSGTDERAEEQLRAILGTPRPPIGSRPTGTPPRARILVNVALAAVVLIASVVAIVAIGAHRAEPTRTGMPSVAVTPRLFVTPSDFFDSQKGMLFQESRLRLEVAPNGCIKLGRYYYLQAPTGSTFTDGVINLAGIGKARIGDSLQSIEAEVVGWSGTSTGQVRGTFLCGRGDYLLLGSAYIPQATADSTTLTGLQSYIRAKNSLTACRPRSLNIWTGLNPGGAGGNYYQILYVQNTGSACTLAKTSITATAGSASTRLKNPEGRAGTVLPHGATAYLRLHQFSSCGHGGPRSQEPMSITIGGLQRTLSGGFPVAPVADCGPLMLELGDFAGAEAFQTTNADYTGPARQLEVSGASSGGYSGGPLDYTVTITNTGSKPYDLPECPSFVEIAVGSGHDVVQTGTLSCAPGSTIPAGGSKTYAVHSNGAGDGTAIQWYLVDGPGTTNN